MSVGFIRDKLEIKFLILYVTAGVAEPMPLSDIQALTMIDDGIDYFDFSQCLNELVKTDHLRINEHQQYAITPKGLKNSEICQSSLPYSVRMKADRLIAAHRQELVRRAQVRAQVERYIEAGVNTFSALIFADSNLEETRDHMQFFAEEIISKYSK